MLLPLGVKILWFVLSITGLFACWVVLLALGRTVDSRWSFVVYGIGCTVLEGIFCIGIIWKMDPFSMPKRFCTAQSVFIALGWFLVSGVVCAFSYMTNQIVLKPKTWGDRRFDPLSWNTIHMLPVVAFPIAALTLHLALILKLGAVRPAVEFYCDSSSPQWVRFLSYAGTPLLVSIPSLWFSIRSVLRVQEINKHISRARTSEIDMGETSEETYTKPGRKDSFKKRLRHKSLKEKQSLDMDDESSAQPSLRFSFPSSGRNSKGSTFTEQRALSRNSPSALRNSVHSGNTNLKATCVHFHIPPKPPSSDESQSDRDIQTIGFTSFASSSPDSDMPSISSFQALERVYSAPVNHSGLDHAIEKVGRKRSASDTRKASRKSAEDRKGQAGDHWEGLGAHNRDQDQTDKDSVAHDKQELDDGDSVLNLGELRSEEGNEDMPSEAPRVGVRPQLRMHGKAFHNFSNDTVLPATFRSRRPSLPNLSHAIWRLILFQLSFVFIQFIGSLSTLIDVAKHASAPSPLGTHHFAMLFVAWGPVFFFGSLKSVRKNMIFVQTTS